MWTLLCALLLAVSSVVSSLDSNIIRSSREIMDTPQTAPPSQRDTVDVSAHNIMRRRQEKQGGVDCSLEQLKECRGSKKRQCQGGKIRPSVEDACRGKVPEMGVCLRSRDCEDGLCCAQYLTGRRCQRIPKEGEVCFLRGRHKTRRNLDRCDCGAGLRCRPQTSSLRGQGVCHI
ncbi:dickkopf-related protein 4-like [Pygocentrus nattereri]|uniref:dickkopf-related protein 4-like n=1 Tax=Pygocentrus nattereri TaxID=42514 RepID=UPI00081446F1|nr:dickkopf-related protein 4-like [Pygocentrus nattereri]